MILFFLIVFCVLAIFICRKIARIHFYTPDSQVAIMAVALTVDLIVLGILSYIEFVKHWSYHA